VFTTETNAASGLIGWKAGRCSTTLAKPLEALPSANGASCDARCIVERVAHSPKTGGGLQMAFEDRDPNLSRSPEEGRLHYGSKALVSSGIQARL